jgi:cell division protein FtsA
MKTLYGSALASPSDEREMIDVPQVGESEADSANHIPRSMLTGIIQPRLEETFELVRDRLEASGYGRVAGRRVVLTGGASQLNGARELASRMLDKQVRIGQPIRLTGLAEATGGPAFSTCAGLLTYSQISPLETAGAESEAEGGTGRGQFRKFGRWLKENF